MRSTFAPRLLATLALTLVGGPLLSAPLAAQTRPLEIADYRIWRSIGGDELSPDGAWAAWSYSKIRMDDTLHVQHLDQDRSHMVPRGSQPSFSDDGRWIAYRVSAPWDDEDGEERIGLMELSTGQQWSWTGPGSFGFAPGSRHFHIKKRTGDEDTDGTDLIVRNLAEGYDELIGGVDEFGWDADGSHLAWTIDAADDDGNGVYLMDAATGARRALDNANLSYERLTWHEDGGALAVLRGETPDGMEERENQVVVASGIGTGTPVVRSLAGAGLNDGWVISSRSGLDWNENGTMLFLATKPQAEEVDDWDDDNGLPLADVNIWHWDDDRIQSVQQATLNRDRARTWTAALHLSDGALAHLADEKMSSVQPTPDGRWAIGSDGTPYISDWRPSYSDYYRVDTRTGARTPILTQQLRTLGMSPDGAHWLYWKDGDIHLYSIDENSHRNLTASAPVDFTDAEYDNHGEHPPYGVQGWAADDEGLVLRHRFDLWLQPLDGSAARSLTAGRGDADQIRFTIDRTGTDPDQDYIDLDEPVLLAAFGTRTKKDGWFELDGDDLNEIAFEDVAFSGLTKADDADRWMFSVETFASFPDLYVSGSDLTQRRKITDANPQQVEYDWGHRILFDYENSRGVPLQGILAIPDSYQQGQRLPMIVRFYEQMSDELHQYAAPAYRHSPNFSGYVSNGYLIMQPDVHFQVGPSHSDMLDAVEAATQAVIDMGYADPDAIGLSGHSYSGGGGAFIATRSDMFAAVAHGAAPINLVSEFNQLWVGGGQNNHQYDIYGQGRYATDPYADFDLYWDQSPISGVEEMNTPVLYLHGESDGTVNWEQGLEWYNALRFLGKPIIWLSYPDEGHGLSKLQNRIDFQYRLRQFFDHHLKGAPAPKWMEEGIPQLDKDRHLREFAPNVFRGGDSGSGTDGAGGGNQLR